MPYDPTPVGPGVDAHGRRESLTVQIEGRGEEPERLLVLGRPRDGWVSVRETVAGLAPRDHEATVVAMRAVFERAHHERRRMSAELHLVREWLDGRG